MYLIKLSQNPMIGIFWLHGKLRLRREGACEIDQSLLNQGSYWPHSCVVKPPMTSIPAPTYYTGLPKFKGIPRQGFPILSSDPQCAVS